MFILYRLVPSLKYKNLLLAAASIVFYAFGQLHYVPLFLFSVLINFFSGLLLQGESQKRKLILAISVLLNIGILCYYKYTDFLLRNINDAFSLSLPYRGIELPIGISFFTFQGLSYTIDVYRDKKTGTKDFLKLLLYISFFPQLIAGPIVKYHDISDQIACRHCSAEETAYGISRFVIGLAKKVLIANAVGYIADYVFNRCLLTSDCPPESCFLGRPWREDAKAVFLRCRIGGHIRKELWDDWGKEAAHTRSFFAGYDCMWTDGAREGKAVDFHPSSGPAASFSHCLSKEEAAEYIPENVLQIREPDFWKF